MKLTDKYYEKIYKHTEKITKKLFKKDVGESLRRRFEVKQEIEKIIKKSITEITTEEIVSNKLGCLYAEYRTLSQILDILESACILKTFTIEEYENGYKGC